MELDDVGALVQRWQTQARAGSGDCNGLVGIGTFARRCRLSLKALRLYDRLGVLVPDRTPAHAPM
ncbi:MAG TPA: hypothetical protein VHX59_05795 [Mycobacteriales bacterium]|jgi:hypothetical protein|nr:hypothetical protein [Mycobacteriales bacterium]